MKFSLPAIVFTAMAASAASVVAKEGTRSTVRGAAAVLKKEEEKEAAAPFRHLMMTGGDENVKMYHSNNQASSVGNSDVVEIITSHHEDIKVYHNREGDEIIEIGFPASEVATEVEQYEVASSSNDPCDATSCDDYHFLIDCSHSSISDINTGTDSTVDAYIFDVDTDNQVGHYNFQNGFCQDTKEERICFSTCNHNNVNEIDLHISGDDAVLIDRIRLYKNGYKINRWDLTNSGAWCLSTDPYAYNGIADADWSDVVMGGDNWGQDGKKCVDQIYFYSDRGVETGNLY